MVYIGVDPGSKTGAYAAITTSDKGDAVEVFPWDNNAFIEWVIEKKASGAGCSAVVERVWSMPKEAASGAFAFGSNAGFIEGTLRALKVRVELVVPKTWKKEFGLNGNKTNSIEVCHRLFPDVNLKRTEKCRKDDSNFAEALLMAEYAKRHF